MAALDQHQKNLAKLLRENAHRHRIHEVFRDFCEIAALTYSNQFSRHKYDEREARYLDIVGRYERPEVERFAAMIGELVMSLRGRFRDALGELFMSLELGDAFKGQFFTPHEVSSLMAHVTLSDVASVIERNGFFTLCEPACGAGGMVIACAEVVQSHGFKPHQVMHVTATDIDATAVHMAFAQLAILGIPAVVVHGNTLSVQEWDQWATPAHVFGGWRGRLRRRSEASQPRHEEASESIPAPQEESGEVAKTLESQLNQLQLFV